MMIKEEFPHAVSGFFTDPQSARERMRALLDTAGLEEQQVKLVAPGDPGFGPKVEPESRRIFATLLSAHFWTALIGLLFGLAAAWLMVGYGPVWAGSNPLLTFIAFAWVGTLATALIGGVITLRPDRDSVTMTTRKASRQGRWTVVAHCRGQDEKAAALRLLEADSEATRRSL